MLRDACFQRVPLTLERGPRLRHDFFILWDRDSRRYHLKLCYQVARHDPVGPPPKGKKAAVLDMNAFPTMGAAFSTKTGETSSLDTAVQHRDPPAEVLIPQEWDSVDRAQRRVSIARNRETERRKDAKLPAKVYHKRRRFKWNQAASTDGKDMTARDLAAVAGAILAEPVNEAGGPAPPAAGEAECESAIADGDHDTADTDMAAVADIRCDLLANPDLVSGFAAARRCSTHPTIRWTQG